VADTFTTLWNRLRLRAPSIDAALAQDFVRDSFNQLAERRDWSWRTKHSAFVPPVFNTGADTVSTVANYTLVTSTNGSFTQDMVGMQIRIGSVGNSSYPTYTVVQYLGATQVMIDTPWKGPSLTAQRYQVFQCYFPVPADFQSFISLVNTTNSYRLYTNLTQSDLDTADPQRIQAGMTYAAAFYDYSSNYNGTVSPGIPSNSVVQPVITTATGYTYPVDSMYVVQIISGGAVGTSTFVWKQDNTDWSAPIPTSADAYNLSSGVLVYFPTGNYTAGDVFVALARANVTAGVPRYELWPRPINAPYVLPYIYTARLPDLTDENPGLPPFIASRGDVLLEMALEKCASWPGTTIMRNPYFDVNLAQRHASRAETLIWELEKRDDEVAMRDLAFTSLSYYPAPWLDGKWQQQHAPFGPF
jgi:hypothetical protein